MDYLRLSNPAACPHEPDPLQVTVTGGTAEQPCRATVARCVCCGSWVPMRARVYRVQHDGKVIEFTKQQAAGDPWMEGWVRYLDGYRGDWSIR